MSENVLLEESELPRGFCYPREFRHIVELGLINLEPWYIIFGEELRRTHEGLRERFPTQTLVPFARRQDNDDVACWDVGQLGSVLIVHDFASSGWEERGRFAEFWGWFRRAIEDLIEFDSL